MYEFGQQSKVYKTIKFVSDKGVGTEIDFGYNVKQFKCKNGCEHHNHMVCVLCGAYRYIDDEGLEDFQDKLAKITDLSRRGIISKFLVCAINASENI